MLDLVIEIVVFADLCIEVFGVGIRPILGNWIKQCGLCFDLGCLWLGYLFALGFVLILISVVCFVEYLYLFAVFVVFLCGEIS